MNDPSVGVPARHRIPGYDLARFAAVFGFVVVDMVGRVLWSDGEYGTQPEGPTILHWMHKMWWGRASSMLAVLAGTGMALMFRPGQDEDAVTRKKRVVLRRCAFLFVAGHLWNSSTLWNWSILHYYTFFLAIGLLFVEAKARTLLIGAVLFMTVSTVDTLAFKEWPDWAGDEAVAEASDEEAAPSVDKVVTDDAPAVVVDDPPADDASAVVADEPLPDDAPAEADGDEEDWEGDFGDPKIWQAEFWSVRGQVTDTLFDGMYPVFPWMAFLLIGMWVVRVGLDEAARRRRILIGALATMAVSFGIWWLARGNEALGTLTSVDRWPAMPLYVLSCSGQAVAILCLCLTLASWKPDAKWIAPLAATGQMTFSVYIFRIFIGGGDRAGLYDWICFADGSDRANLVDGWIRVAVFMPLMILICHFWVRRFGRGPLEAAMRRCSDG